MNLRKKRFFLIIGLFILFLISEFSFLPSTHNPEKISIINIPNATQTIQRSVASDLPPTTVETAVQKTQSTNTLSVTDEEFGKRIISCLHQLIKEASEKCDEDCVIQFLQKNGSIDAHRYIAEGFFRSKGKEIKNITNPQTKLGRLHLALFFANLLSTSEKLKAPPNYPRAEELLNELLTEEPENAALYFYLAAMSYKQERKLEAKKILELMNSKATYYDEYLSTWHKDFNRSSYAINSAVLIEAISKYSYPPHSPDVLYLMEMQKNLNFNFKQLGQLMIKDGLDSKLVFDLDHTWDHTQYDLGLRLIYYTNQKTNWRSNPHRKLPTSVELFEEYRKVGPQFQDEIGRIRGELQAALVQNCSIDVYEDWVKKYPEVAFKYGR